ncbi:MAG: FAD-binding protein [Nocardioidaceae bacterium]
MRLEKPTSAGRRKAHGDEAMTATNWAGNITFGARRINHPSSLQELQQLVASSERVRGLGTGHSFNRIADTTGDLVSVAGLPVDMELDSQRNTVNVSAGVRYGELARYLHERGRALRNLGSLPHISVAGACATGTHGSGDSNGNLSTAVSGMELVTASGETATLSRGNDEAFDGAVVALGSLGIVTRLTLDTVPAFDIAQYVYEDLPEATLVEAFDDIFSTAYSVSAFTDWGGPRVKQVWVKVRTDADATSGDGSWVPEPSWLGARLATRARHPVPGMSPVNCTLQAGVPGPWHERLPHFRLEFTPSSGEELQSEYLLPREHAAAAVGALSTVGDLIAPVLQIGEIRTVAGDNLWMSPCYRRDTAAFHFTWVKDMSAVAPVVRRIEERLSAFGARPHWGKVFGRDFSLIAGQYERLPDFQQLARAYDPTGKFRNDFVDRYLFDGS